MPSTFGRGPVSPLASAAGGPCPGGWRGRRASSSAGRARRWRFPPWIWFPPTATGPSDDADSRPELAAEGSRLASWLGNRALEAHTTFIGLFLVLMMVSTVLEIVMVARGRYLSASSLYGLSDLVRAAFLLVPVLLVPRLESLLVGAVVFAALRFGSTIGYFMHAFGADFRPQATLLRNQLAYAAPFALAVLVDIFQST